MARVEIPEVVAVKSGSFLAPVTGARVQVNVAATGAAATVYAAETGGTTLTNPLVTTNGNIEGWLEPGTYTLVVSGTEAQTGIAGGITGYSKSFQAVDATAPANAEVVRTIRPVTGSFTFLSTDTTTVVEVDSTTAATATVPTGLPANSLLVVHQRGTGAVSLVPGSGMTLNARPGGQFTLGGQYGTAFVRVRSSTNAVAYGDLADAATTNPGGGGSPITPATYPSRMTVGNNKILDENGYDVGVLKGFNTNVASTTGNPGFLFAQSDYDAMTTLTNSATVPGPGINRLVCHWDVFEQSQGVFHGISSPTGAATAGSAFDSLDKSIARAAAAGRYVLLDIHLLDAGASNGRVPAWARTGTTPSGSGNAWTWFITNGQGLVSTMAQRYANNKTVLGLDPNEPPTVTQETIMQGYETLVPWYRTHAPMWPIWVSPFAYGGGTPYPASGGVVNLTRLLALDTNNRGIILDWRNYLNMVGTASTNGYQANGSIDPVQQVANGSQYYGWGTAYTYPNTTASRAALAAHIQPIRDLKDASPRIALALTEFGNDNAAQGASHDAWIKDNVDLFRAAGAVAEIWWQYGVNQPTFDSGSTTGSGWRAGISGTPWIKNATPRAGSTTTTGFSDGFETGTGSAWSSQNTAVAGTVAYEAGSAYSGAYGVRFTNTAASGSIANLRHNFTARDDYEATAMIRWNADSGSSSNNGSGLRFFAGGTRVVDIYRQDAVSPSTSGTIWVRNRKANATDAFTTTGQNAVIGTWVKVSMRVVYNGPGTVSQVIVKLNDVQVLNLSNVDLISGGFDTLQLGTEHPQIINVSVDDVVASA